MIGPAPVVTAPRAKRRRVESEGCVDAHLNPCIGTARWRRHFEDRKSPLLVIFEIQSSVAYD
jgi:hypothetical protein